MACASCKAVDLPECRRAKKRQPAHLHTQDELLSACPTHPSAPWQVECCTGDRNLQVRLANEGLPFTTHRTAISALQWHMAHAAGSWGAATGGAAGAGAVPQPSAASGARPQAAHGADAGQRQRAQPLFHRGMDAPQSFFWEVVPERR